jgi:hypothetical protein
MERPTITTTENIVSKIEVTADYCFQRAAEALAYSGCLPGEGVEVAREWRELGTALLDVARHGG